MASSVGSIALTPENYTFLKIFTKHQIRPNPKPPLESNSIAKKTAVITGGNGGLGLECARLLLSLKLSHLILAVRTVTKGEEAAESLQKLFPEAKIDVWELDMGSYDSIRAFARKCAALPRLDMALLSAGLMNIKLEINSSTGHEEMFQVNYLSTALLSILLLPILRKRAPSDAPGRLLEVASGAALIAEFSERNEVSLLDALSNSDGWNSSVAKRRYDNSKGLVLMLTLKLSQIVKAENTIVNVVDPSFTPGTSFFRDLPLVMRIVLWPLTKLLGTSVNNAAWRYIDASVARGVESHGSLLSDWEIHPFHPFMYTKEGEKFMDRLWDETIKELDFPEVHEALDSLNKSSTLNREMRIRSEEKASGLPIKALDKVRETITYICHAIEWNGITSSGFVSRGTPIHHSDMDQQYRDQMTDRSLVYASGSLRGVRSRVEQAQKLSPAIQDLALVDFKRVNYNEQVALWVGETRCGRQPYQIMTDVRVRSQMLETEVKHSASRIAILKSKFEDKSEMLEDARLSLEKVRERVFQSILKKADASPPSVDASDAPAAY